MAQLNFDATQVAPDMGFDPLPAGWYNCIMEKSELKPTKGGDGTYLECVFNVVDGQYAGRKLFARINLRNPNPQAQEIGFKQLSAIAHAVGVLHVQNSEQLHGRPLKVRAKIRPADGQYEASNDITGFKNINEDAGGAPAGAAPGGFAPPAGGFTPPPAQAQPPAQTQWNQGAPQQQPQAPVNTGAPVQQPWQAPNGQAPQQPWQQPPAQQQAPQQQAPVQPQQQGVAQGGFNPQTAVPPWQK
jgi:hypothetical protein